MILGKITEMILKGKTDNGWEKAGTSRLLLWKNGIQFFLERPILGYGPENLEVKYLEQGINQDRPHNIIIQLLTTSGIPGCILYISAIRNNTT